MTPDIPPPSPEDRASAIELRRRLDRGEGHEWISLRALRSWFGGHALSPARRREIERALRAAGIDVHPPLARRTTRGSVRLEAFRTAGRGSPPRDRLRTSWSRLRARLLTPTGALVTLLASFYTLAGPLGVFSTDGGDAARRVPGRMSGDVNVAVAPFEHAGRVAPDGAALARDAAADLRVALPRLDRSLHFKVRSLGGIAALGERDAAGRARAAQALAHKVGADVLVYGELASSPAGTHLSPLFQLNTEKLPSAQALAGGYGGDETIALPYSIDVNPQARAELRHALVRRTVAYAAALVGVGYYLQHSLRRADRYLRRARTASAEAASVPLLDLLLGNVEAQRHAFAAAQRAYTVALHARATHARAAFGLAELAYQHARGTCRSGDVDPVGLQRAHAAFRRAARGTAAAANPTLAAKVRFGLGQVDLCLSASGTADRWQATRRQLAAVLRAYRRELPELRDDAAEAHAGIGLSDLALLAPPAAYAAARDAYQAAADTTTIASRRAFFESMVGFAELRMGDRAAAAAAYRHAATAAGNTIFGRAYAAKAARLATRR